MFIECLRSPKGQAQRLLSQEQCPNQTEGLPGKDTIYSLGHQKRTPEIILLLLWKAGCLCYHLHLKLITPSLVAHRALKRKNRVLETHLIDYAVVRLKVCILL